MLLLENKLSAAIKNLLQSETRLHISVAFIGNGASQLIGQQAKQVKIICNLTMGGTNPKEVANLIGRFGNDNVKQIDNLHAKLYIGTEYAIVGSANMSTNGLGIQPTALREAGYKFKIDHQNEKDTADWFDTLWNEAKGITEKNLKDAEDKWNSRDRARNGDWKANSGSICDYDFDRPDFPLLDWIGTNDSEILNDQPIDKSSLGGWDTLAEANDNGVDIQCKDDLSHLRADRWILNFYPGNKKDPYWLQLSGNILNGSVAVSKRGSTSGPFKIDKDFVNEFRTLLFGSKKYSDLVNENFKDCWFHPRIPMMQEFWKELQSILCKRKPREIFTEE